ncbi:unnamed protein product [Staurois parvus]|uniref:Uncharacterized protein n=1 Tax=Staurois parvus TaxID=386267 RepID=A0ABN9C1G6_9NEOB|nr:unnamed protein product [Staurois parvus]
MIGTHLCPPVPPTSATHQCSQSVPPIIVAYQCSSITGRLISASLPVSPIIAAYQCPSVLPIHATSSVLPISVASSTHISEGEKLPVCKIL